MRISGQLVIMCTTWQSCSYTFFIFCSITIIVWVRNWTSYLGLDRQILYDSTDGFYNYYSDDEGIFTIGVCKVSQKEKKYNGGKCCVNIAGKKSHLFGQVNGINSDCVDSTVDLLALDPAVQKNKIIRLCI